jgi:hypothetical protein
VRLDRGRWLSVIMDRCPRSCADGAVGPSHNSSMELRSNLLNPVLSKSWQGLGQLIPIHAQSGLARQKARGLGPSRKLTRRTASWSIRMIESHMPSQKYPSTRQVAAVSTAAMDRIRCVLTAASCLAQHAPTAGRSRRSDSGQSPLFLGDPVLRGADSWTAPDRPEDHGSARLFSRTMVP